MSYSNRYTLGKMSIFLFFYHTFNELHLFIFATTCLRRTFSSVMSGDVSLSWISFYVCLLSFPEFQDLFLRVRESSWDIVFPPFVSLVCRQLYCACFFIRYKWLVLFSMYCFFLIFYFSVMFVNIYNCWRCSTPRKRPFVKIKQTIFAKKIVTH